MLGYWKTQRVGGVLGMLLSLVPNLALIWRLRLRSERGLRRFSTSLPRRELGKRATARVAAGSSYNAPVHHFNIYTTITAAAAGADLPTD